MPAKVTVSITTYDHAPFIAQAIDSVLMQQAGFDVEILIGEDDSTDGTREIVQRYAQAHPGRIRLFLNSRSDVITIRGRPSGRWNLINNLTHATGQYIALLDGDDFWTSPHKLQRQVEVLDANPGCAICFHPVRKQDDTRSGETWTFRPRPVRDRYTLADLLMRNLMATPSVMFRNGLIGELPPWYRTVLAGDWPLHVLNAQHGDIRYIDEIMAVHRIHGGGIWSPRQTVQRLRDQITMLETFREHLPPECTGTIDESMALRHLQIVRALSLAGQRRQATTYGLGLLLDSPVPRRSLLQAGRRIWREKTGREGGTSPQSPDPSTSHV